jgi:uncharacterized damage-inducible protein DinB
MSETARIRDQLRRAYEGDAWHGPSLRELLSGVRAEQAARRHLSGAHTIWEIVLHLDAWMAAAARAIAGEPMPQPPWEGDWPPPAAASEKEWVLALDALERTERALEAAVENLSDARLEEKVPGREYSFYYLLHGIVQHNTYHAGQIILLKKL